MTLWNLIRDFFVEHIFGGFNSNHQVFNSNFIGQVNNSNVDGGLLTTGDSYFLPIANRFIDGDDIVREGPIYIGLGDWLSTTFTIITLILLIIFLYIFVKWIFKLFSGLLK